MLALIHSSVNGAGSFEVNTESNKWTLTELSGPSERTFSGKPSQEQTITKVPFLSKEVFSLAPMFSGGFGHSMDRRVTLSSAYSETTEKKWYLSEVFVLNPRGQWSHTGGSCLIW